MPETPPRTIGRYEIRRELGRGMMGIVYEALDPDLGRTVALKTIQLMFALTPAEREVFEQRFLAEARIASRLAHPGIVAVHDAGRDPESGTLYIALEYLRGRTLSQIIKEGVPLPWREALRITARVAEALHHAHTHGVIHRDVKPANIMVLPSGDPKLMDFGIAKTETARIKLTATGQFFGTPLYMAPEQALGRVVDARADLFSLGSIAYTLLTGTTAFGAENITKIIGRVVREDPPAPSSLVGGLPAEIDYVLARALAKDPSHRYPSGGMLAEDIQDILAGAPPRHSAGWTSPMAEVTLVEPLQGEVDLEGLLQIPAPARAEDDLPTLDLEAQLATLVPEAPGAPPSAASGPQSPPPEDHRAASPQRPDGAVSTPAPRPMPARLELRWLFAILAAGAFVALGVARVRRVSPGAAPSSSLPSSPTLASPGPGPPLPAPEPGRLAIEFEHSLKRGVLRVWVDRELVVEENIDDHARRLTAFRFRGSASEEALALSPGGHDVEVQVAWDDSAKTERIWGDLPPGGTRRLHARIGGLFKKLSLEWE